MLKHLSILFLSLISEFQTNIRFSDPLSYQVFKETSPLAGSYCCVLEKDTQSSQCLFPPRRATSYRQTGMAMILTIRRGG